MTNNIEDHGDCSPPQRTLSLSSPMLMVRRFWLWMVAAVVLLPVLPGVMMIGGETLML